MKRMSRRARVEDYFKRQINTATNATKTYPQPNFDDMTMKELKERAQSYHQGRLEGYQEAMAEILSILDH